MVWLSLSKSPLESVKVRRIKVSQAEDRQIKFAMIEVRQK